MMHPWFKNRQRLLHMEEACGKIRKYNRDVDREGFLNDPKLQDATLYQLIIIGEAVARLDQELLDKYPYPWFKIKAFRNYAAHEYFNIALWTVWEVIDQHLGELEAQVEVMLEEF